MLKFLTIGAGSGMLAVGVTGLFGGIAALFLGAIGACAVGFVVWSE